MNIDIISKSIIVKPTSIQIAKDRKWENAWILPCSQQFPTEKKVETYLKSESFETIEVELVFEQSNGIRIFGIDHTKHLLIPNPKDFILEIFKIVENYSDFISCIHLLDQSLIGNEYFLRQDPDLIRIGVVNHWFSVGPLLLWKKGQEKIMKRSRLKQHFLEKPKVFSTHLNYQGMSFVMNLASQVPRTCHWIKAPCSTKVGNRWILNPTMIQLYLNEWDDFQII